MNEREEHQAAMDMLNEIHRRMGTPMVYQMNMAAKLVDKIAMAHIRLAYNKGKADAEKELTFSQR